MSKKIYEKEPLTYHEQVTLLQKRGLHIPNYSEAISYLEQISYYRLSAYFLPYQAQKDKFNKGVSLTQIIDTYSLDRELRLLIFDCIERIEIALRAQLVYVLAHRYKSSHWQDIPSVFKPTYLNHKKEIIDPFADIQRIIANSCKVKHPEVFIKHYLDTYDKPKNPPAWMCLELLTIGELSKLYIGLADNQDQKDIAKFFNLHQSVFTSWLHTISYVRNMCAHHSRLWNREFAIKPDILRKPWKPWIDKSFNKNERTFYFLCMLQYLLKYSNSGNYLKNKFQDIINKYPNVPIKFMGIPSDDNGILLAWDKQPVWSL